MYKEVLAILIAGSTLIGGVGVGGDAAGVPADRARTVSHGKERPAVVGSTESPRLQNRRAVTAAE